MTRVRLATVAANPDGEAALASAISLLEDVELVFRCVDRVELLGAVRGGDIDAAVCVGVPSWFDLEILHEARIHNAQVVVLTDDPGDHRLASGRVHILSIAATIQQILDACLEPHLDDPLSDAPACTADKRCRMVAVWGPKGAPGRTRVAIELSAHIAWSGRDVLLIDGDPYGGDVGQLVGISDEVPTVVWAARRAARDELAQAHLRGLGRVIEGLTILPGLPRADMWADVSDIGWQQLLCAAHSCFDYVIVDAGCHLETWNHHFAESGEGRNRMTRVALRTADHAVAVFNADPIGLKNLIRSYPLLAELVEPEAISLVANRMTRGRDAEVADILRRHLSRRQSVAIPDRPVEMRRAVMAASSVLELDQKSPVHPALRGLAASLGAAVPAEGFLSKLSGRR